MKTGLVLEGGGVRGIYTAGVLDVFMEHGIGFDGVIGVSAGAIHGCSYLSGQRGRSIRYYKAYCRDPRFMSLRSLITTGDLVGVDFCYHELPEKLDVYDNDAFMNAGVPFYAVCTNVKTGQAEYLPITDMFAQVDILRASASLPYVSRMVPVDGKTYLDGGVADSIPLEAFRKLGYVRNVVVLTREADYRKKASGALLPKLFYRRYPAFAKALVDRADEYNRALARVDALEKEGEVFVIRPAAPLPVGRTESDPEKIQQTYDIGREDAQRCLQALTAWLTQHEE